MIGVQKCDYPEDLREGAKAFLLSQFKKPDQYGGDGFLKVLTAAAMHIVQGAAWVQPQNGEAPKEDESSKSENK